MLFLIVVLSIVWFVIAFIKQKGNQQAISLILVVVAFVTCAVLEDLPKNEKFISETYIKTIEMTDEYYTFDEDVKVSIHQSETGTSYIEVYKGKFDTPIWAKILLFDFTDTFDIYKVYHAN